MKTFDNPQFSLGEEVYAISKSDSLVFAKIININFSHYRLEEKIHYALDGEKQLFSEEQLYRSFSDANEAYTKYCKDKDEVEIAKFERFL